MFLLHVFVMFVDREDSEKSSVRIGTADILSMLKKNEPDVDFTLALGTDTFIDLASGKWRRTDEVFELVGQRMVVFHRLLEDGEHIQKDAMLKESIAKRNKDGQSTIQLIQIPTLTDASSSSVRQTSDESILRNLLTADVLEYMKQMKMYAFSDSNVSNEV